MKSKEIHTFMETYLKPIIEIIEIDKNDMVVTSTACAGRPGYIELPEDSIKDLWLS